MPHAGGVLDFVKRRIIFVTREDSLLSALSTLRLYFLLSWVALIVMISEDAARF